MSGLCLQLIKVLNNNFFFFPMVLLLLHLSYPTLKPLDMLNAHPANCICLKFDPTGKYFATGSADALVSLWDVAELVCVRTFSRWVSTTILERLDKPESVDCVIYCLVSDRLLFIPNSVLFFSHDISLKEEREIEIYLFKTLFQSSNLFYLFSVSGYKIFLSSSGIALCV